MTVTCQETLPITDRLLALMARELDALTADSEEDYALSRHIVARALSEKARNFRRCPLRACRRARRCADHATPCAGHRRHLLPLALEKGLIDNVYVRLQEMREAR